MARLKLHPLCETASGKAKTHSNVSFRYYGNKQYTYTWNTDTVIQATPARLLQRQAMKQANLDATAILADPVQTAEWKQRFEQQTKYRHFRPFIVATRMAEIKSSHING